MLELFLHTIKTTTKTKAMKVITVSTLFAIALLGSFKTRYVLSKTDVSVIPEPSVLSIDNVKYLFHIKTRLTQQDAITKCETLGGSLLRITNRTTHVVSTYIMQERYILATSTTATDNNIASYWIDAKKKNKVWAYTDGSKMEYFEGYTNTSDESGHNCAEVLFDNEAFGNVSPQDCAEMRSFICEILPRVNNRKISPGYKKPTPLSTVTIRDVMIVEIVILGSLFFVFVTLVSIVTKLTTNPV